MTSAIWLRSEPGLAPGMVLQISADTACSGETLVIGDPMLEVVEGLLKSAWPNFDPYGVTVIPTERWVGISTQLEIGGKDLISADSAMSDQLGFAAGWIRRRLEETSHLVVLGY